MWKAIVGGLAALAVIVMLFGVWYAEQTQYHEVRPGWESRMEITIWPPSIGWGERQIRQR